MKKVMKKAEVNMLSGSIVKGLFSISIPIVVMNVMQAFFNIIDMAILKNHDLNSSITVGAIGVCSVLIPFITGLMIGVSTGANIVVARCIGQGNKKMLERAVGTSILLSVAGGLLLLAAGVSFAEVFLKWANCPPAMMKDALLYFRLYFVGAPVLIFYNFCAAILRSSGDTRNPMVFMVLSGIVKIILTFMFVGVLGMGIVGVSLSTFISWTISAMLAFNILRKKDCAVRINIKSLRFYKKELWEILKIGIPAGVQSAIYSVSNVVITSAVNSFGADATTGFSIANSFDDIIYYIAVAPSLAIMPYVSQNVGNGNMKRATEAVRKGIMITVGLGGLFGMVSATCSAGLASFMTNDPVIISYAQQKMVLISSTYFICGINEIMGAALRGMGRPTIATYCTLIYMCAIRFGWVYMVFPYFRNLTCLYLIWPIGWSLSLITLLFFLFSYGQKTNRRSYC